MSCLATTLLLYALQLTIHYFTPSSSASKLATIASAAATDSAINLHAPPLKQTLLEGLVVVAAEDDHFREAADGLKGGHVRLQHEHEKARQREKDDKGT